jgi:hypothetical protein
MQLTQIQPMIVFEKISEKTEPQIQNNQKLGSKFKAQFF